MTYFCEQLVADERRQKLFEYFGSKTDEEIINESPSIHQLKEIIGNDDIKTARERVLQEQKRINETLKNIPVKSKVFKQHCQILKISTKSNY